MILTLNITMDNAAFDDGNEGRTEAARILRKVADRIEAGHHHQRLMDINGNHVGDMEIDDEAQ